MKSSTLFECGPLPPTSTRHPSGDRGCQAFLVFHALPLRCIKNKEKRERPGNKAVFTVKCLVLQINVLQFARWFLWYSYRMKLVENLQLTPAHNIQREV